MIKVAKKRIMAHVIISVTGGRARKENNVIKLMIRNEELLDDFFKLFNLIGIDLTEELKMEIRKIKKTNVSLRSLTTADYYDDETKELVANREKLIINKYNYKFPI